MTGREEPTSEELQQHLEKRVIAVEGPEGLEKRFSRYGVPKSRPKGATTTKTVSKAKTNNQKVTGGNNGFFNQSGKNKGKGQNVNPNSGAAGSTSNGNGQQTKGSNKGNQKTGNTTTSDGDDTVTSKGNGKNSGATNTTNTGNDPTTGTQVNQA